MRRVILIIIFLNAITYVTAQEIHPDSLIQQVKNEYLKISDYQADIKVKVDVDFIKIPDKHATIYFKQPDKITYKAEEFILLPKKGMNFSINELLKHRYSTIYIGQEILNETNQEIIKIIPHDPKSEIILATLWIDNARHRISKIETNSKKAGSYSIEFTYSEETEILPVTTKFSFEITNLDLPFNVFFDSNPDFFKEKSKKKKNGKSTEGSVTIYYSNYKINEGIPDSVFND